MSTPDENPENPFEVVSGRTFSREDRYKRWWREYALVPAKIIWDDWRTRVGSLIVLFYLLMGTVGVYLVPSPDVNGPQLLGPFQSLQYPLGTTHLGQDLLALMVHSTPTMLLMLVSGAFFTTVLATVVATYSGYKGGRIDKIIMSINDVVLTIPGLALMIVLSVTFSPTNPVVVGVLLSINAWAGLARSIRSEVLPLREMSYVEASRTMGTPTSTILTKDILPNLMPFIAINFVAAGRRVIFNSVALYFLGVLPLETLNWGVVLNQAYKRGALYVPGALHWIVVPLISIIGLTVGLVLFAQGTERLFNPRIRARHADTEGSERP